MLVCRMKVEGNIIEMQSKATPGTLIANAVAAGYKVGDIEELEVTEAQYQTALLADPVYVAVDTVTKTKEAKLAKATVDLKALVSTDNPDATKWKMETVVAHIIQIETLLNIR